MPREREFAPLPNVLDKHLGERAGVCHAGWSHAYEPDACELDSVVEEMLLDVTADHEQISRWRAELHRGIPRKHELHRLHATGEVHADGHGHALVSHPAHPDNPGLYPVPAELAAVKPEGGK